MSYDSDLYKAHTEAIYTALLIHLDDPSDIIQVYNNNNNNNNNNSNNGDGDHKYYQHCGFIGGFLNLIFTMYITDYLLFINCSTNMHVI